MLTPTRRARGPVYGTAELDMLLNVVGGSMGPGVIALSAARQFSQSAEDNLQAQINAEVQARQTADTTEAGIRAYADMQEGQARAAADTALDARIAALEALRPRRAIITYAGADFTWTYPTAFPVGTVPVISAVVVGRTTDNGLLNCQIVGDPTNTSCRVRVNNVANSSVSLLGLVNLNLFSQAPSGVKVHLVAYLP